MSRMIRIYLIVLLQLLTASLSSAVYAAEAETLIKQLPRSYAGEFQWRDSVRIYKVTLQFTNVRVLDTGVVEATGTGIYDEYGSLSMVNIRAEIDPKDLFLEIWETDPVAAGRELEGMYRGDLSEDMQTITAMWRSFTDKNRGYLNLKVKK